MSRKQQQDQDQGAPTNKQIDDAVAKDTANIEAGVKSGELSRQDADDLEAQEKDLADSMKSGQDDGDVDL